MLEFDRVSKKYANGNVVALNEISFRIEEGEFVFLIGPSGAGKSTVVKLIAGEEFPTKGKIIFKGIEVNKLKGRKLALYRRMLGIVFQDFKLLLTRTVEENVSFVLEVMGLSSKQIKERVNYVLELVGLEDKKRRFPNSLSGGEQQRLAIARAMANEPELLLADEPTGNLDEENAWYIMQLLNKINNWGTTIILATHDMEMVESIVDKRIISFDKGNIVNDTANEIYQSSLLKNKE